MDNDKMQQQFSNDNASHSPSGEPHNTYQGPNEMTYWESQAMQEPETAEQFYQYYEMQMKKRAGIPYEPQRDSQPPVTDPGPKKPLPYGVQASYSENIQGNNTLYDPTSAAIYLFNKRRKKRRLIGCIAIMLLLVTLGGTAYAFRDTLLNLAVLYTQSPEKYYAYVELKTLEDTVERTTPYLDFNTQFSAMEATTDITLQRDTVDSLMQSTNGTSLNNIEDYIGSSLEHIGFHVISNSNLARSSNQFDFRINRKDILSLEFFTDTIKKEVMLRIPDLSQAYIRQSLDFEDNSFKPDTYNFDFMTREANADLLKRYSKIIIEHISNVAIEKNTDLTLDFFTVSCNKITVTITEEDINKIATAILKEAREDQYLHKFLPSFGLSLEEFQANIDEALERLVNIESANTDGFQMIVYTNNQGKIIGRDISLLSSHGAIGYYYLEKEHMDRYKLFIKDNDGDYILEIGGSQSKAERGYNGSMDILVSTDSKTSSQVSFDITYQGVRNEKIGNRFYHYGSYTLSSLNLNGLQLLIDNAVENQVQTNKITLQLGASPLVVIDTKLDYDTDYQITPPTEDAVIFETTELDSYLATLDMEAFINTLSERLDVDLSWILPYLSQLIPQ